MQTNTSYTDDVDMNIILRSRQQAKLASLAAYLMLVSYLVHSSTQEVHFSEN
jgi:hypothetical protein